MTHADISPDTQTLIHPQKPGYETTAKKIVELIKALSLQPGDRLPPERAIGEQLGVSRTMVREAVKILSATGIVHARQGSGLYVANGLFPLTAAIDISMTVEPHEVRSLFEFRLTIETQTARLAAERITPREVLHLQEAVTRYQQGTLLDQEAQQKQTHESDEAFHGGIAEATHNPFLISATTSIFRLQEWAVSVAIGGTPGSLLVAAEQHAAIFAAIQSGQPDRAAEAMRVHIETTFANYQREVRYRLLNNSSGTSVLPL